MDAGRKGIKGIIVFLFVLSTGCNTYKGELTSKTCCPTAMEFKVGDFHYVLPSNGLYWFDSLDVGDSALINRQPLVIIKKL